MTDLVREMKCDEFILLIEYLFNIKIGKRYKIKSRKNKMKSRRYKDFRVVELECRKSIPLKNSSGDTHDLVKGKSYQMIQSLKKESDFIIPIPESRQIYEIHKTVVFSAFSEKEFILALVGEKNAKKDL